VVNQDLFFACDCLIEGITVETNFAEHVVSRVRDLFRTSTIPSQRRQALNALWKLQSTRQYVDLGRQELKALFTDNTLADISIKLEAAFILYESSPGGSEERREGARLLLARGQREDVSVEQLVQMAQVIYKFSPRSSEERREEVRQLLLLPRSQREDVAELLPNLGQRADVSVEQLIQVAQTIYENGLKDSDERQFALHVIQQVVQNQSASVEQRLREALVPLKVRQNNFTDRAFAVRMIRTLMQREEVENLLAQNWEPMPFGEERRNTRTEQTTPNHDAFIPVIPSIVDLVKQDVLPVEARDEMYQLLSDMIPLFGNIDATGN
jgi:hypothetical protein